MTLEQGGISVTALRVVLAVKLVVLRNACSERQVICFIVTAYEIGILINWYDDDIKYSNRILTSRNCNM